MTQFWGEGHEWVHFVAKVNIPEHVIQVLLKLLRGRQNHWLKPRKIPEGPMRTYILRNLEPVVADAVAAWTDPETQKYRVVAQDNVNGVKVSTVFLILDHSWGSMVGEDESNPVLYETMVFGGEYDEEQERYHTREEAARGHQRWLEKVDQFRGHMKRAINGEEEAGCRTEEGSEAQEGEVGGDSQSAGKDPA